MRPSFRRRVRSIALLEQLGPGLVTGAADDDPSGIATYSQAGARFGYSLLWTLLLTYPLMTAIQLVSAHIGRVTGRGLARNLRAVMPAWAVTTLVVLLFVANTINVGADIAAMGAAAKLVVGGGRHVFTVAFALVSLTLQMFVPYRRYVRFLKWLTLALLAYPALLLMVDVDWAKAGLGLVWPRGPFTREAVTTVVAVFGTTISPYLFFWQSSQEVEEVNQDPEAEPLKRAPRQARDEFARMRVDTFVGMAVSNLIGLSIMIGTAATLHAAGKTEIQTAADAAAALRPVAGPFAFALFSLGIIGTGLLAVPVLAGSAAYAVGETRGWRCGLDHKPWEAVSFYSVIAVATALGVAVDWSPLDPMKALFWSAVVNGVIAVPMMAAAMVVASRHEQMGRFTADLPMKLFGWLATGVMAAAAVAMFAAALAPPPQA
jgi:NRAMP (natural resistance-associated macrophage protein)-like metal ion transporter